MQTLLNVNKLIGRFCIYPSISSCGPLDEGLSSSIMKMENGKWLREGKCLNIIIANLSLIFISKMPSREVSLVDVESKLSLHLFSNKAMKISRRKSSQSENKSLPNPNFDV